MTSKPLNRGELLNRAFPMGGCIPNDAIDLIEANERAKCEAEMKPFQKAIKRSMKEATKL